MNWLIGALFFSICLNGFFLWAIWDLVSGPPSGWSEPEKIAPLHWDEV